MKRMITTYNKTNLIQDLSTKESLTKKQSKEIVNSIFEILRLSIKENDKVFLADFGTFNNKLRESYKFFNAVKNKEIVVENTNRVTFTASKNLKKIVNDEI